MSDVDTEEEPPTISLLLAAVWFSSTTTILDFTHELSKSILFNLTWFIRFGSVRRGGSSLGAAHYCVGFHQRVLSLCVCLSDSESRCKQVGVNSSAAVPVYHTCPHLPDINQTLYSPLNLLLSLECSCFSWFPWELALYLFLVFVCWLVFLTPVQAQNFGGILCCCISDLELLKTFCLYFPGLVRFLCSGVRTYNCPATLCQHLERELSPSWKI